MEMDVIITRVGAIVVTVVAILMVITTIVYTMIASTVDHRLAMVTPVRTAVLYQA